MDDDFDAYRDASPTVLFDLFAEAATRLNGALQALLDRSDSEVESAEIWQRIHALNEVRHGVELEERERQLELIENWHTERRDIRRRLRADA